ncbi:MAG TPA: DUF2279 domain-containing protein [Kofleriaceae bacterium]|nr:DUF2279 domain-containing protein [Kofleriaceae bacterium]
MALLIAWLRHPSGAEPATPEPPPHDPIAAPTSRSTPWLDLGSPPLLEAPSARAPSDHRLAAALTLGGVYAGFTTWTYFAWYRKHKPLAQFRFGGDGWFGARTYAGGADKLGHAWATMSLARTGTELLYQWGGYSRLLSTLVATTLSELLFVGVEVKDGFYYEFSWGDLTGDTAGALVAFALSLSPRLDELFDFRVEYWPSHEYRHQFDGGNINVAEDYSGETYLLAFHLGGVSALRDTCWGGWTRFVDLAVGYGTRGYKPDPPGGEPDYRHRQELSVGLSLNLQGLSDWLFEGRSRPAKKIGHGVFEVFNAGYVPAVEWRKVPSGTVMMGGA